MTTQQKLIKSKMILLDLASYLQNVSEACRVDNLKTGVSRGAGAWAELNPSPSKNQLMDRSGYRIP